VKRKILLLAIGSTPLALQTSGQVTEEVFIQLINAIRVIAPVLVVLIVTLLFVGIDLLKKIRADIQHNTRLTKENGERIRKPLQGNSVHEQDMQVLREPRNRTEEGRGEDEL
jgi:hypothetical protein